jgi:putative salt-induced outer membrane protein YdiY
MRTPLPLLLALPLAAQAPQQPQSGAPAKNWSNLTTLSFVATDGNAKGQTFGFANDYGYKWNNDSSFTFKTGAVRASNTTIQRSAQGATLAEAVVEERSTTALTAETYFANTRFDHRFKDQDKDRWYWYGGLGWERNRPAGLDGKYASAAGFGRIWLDSERSKFRTDLGLGYAYERPMLPPPNFKAHYATATFTSQYQQKIGANAVYLMDLTTTSNTQDSQDYQGVLRQSLTVSINKTMALKVGYDLNYRHKPNQIPVDVYNLDTPPVLLGQVPVLARKMDTTFTASLVITL